MGDRVPAPATGGDGTKRADAAEKQAGRFAVLTKRAWIGVLASKARLGALAGKAQFELLTSKAWFYLALGTIATLAFVVFLIVGYDLFRSSVVDLGKSGPASEWAGALFTALSTLVLAYQLRMIGLAAERRRAQNLDLVQPIGRLTAWARNSSQQGWLLTVAVRNESEEHLQDPQVGLAWFGEAMDEQWLIGAPDEQQDVRNGAAELCVTVSSVKISSVDHPILLIHIPQKACAEMDEVVGALAVTLQWSTQAGPSEPLRVPLTSARPIPRSGVR
ncbi:hypothetical protein ACIA58_07690 [Kribbella sp. NPDC051586]|uniref:hypothetical protein n=1 Tax=Kribbella sp. NPDC051586 TaxID=3364118 RepID=UPI0037AD0CED